MPHEPLTLASTVVATADHSSVDLGGETAILALDTGIYYSIDPIGGRIWSLLQEPRTVGEIRDALLERYDVSEEQCERDVLAFLEQMAGAGLVQIVAR